MRYPWWGPGGDPFGYRPARSRCGTLRTLSPHHGYRPRTGSDEGCCSSCRYPDALPTPPPSYRTPMRYPWWGPGGDPFGNRPARRWRVPFAPPPHHGYRPRIVVRGDPVSSTGQAVLSPVRRGKSSSCRTPMRYPPLQPSYRTPMRYPWWGPGGDPFGYRPARRWRVPFAPPPHHGYRPRIVVRGDPVSSTGQAVFSPVRRGLLSSCRTTIRYPPLPRLTAPRCGIHGGAREETHSATEPARRWRVPFAPPPHHGYRPRIVVRGDPVSSTGQAVFSPVRRGKSSSCRTPMRYPPLPRLTAPPMRYPWWGPGGDPFGYRPARRWRVPFAPPHPTVDTGFHR